MATLVNCAVCHNEVATSARNCPNCGADPFVPCEVCGAEARISEGHFVCPNHQHIKCYYCKNTFYRLEGKNHTIEWVMRDISYLESCVDWQWVQVNSFVCFSCAENHPEPEPKKPRDKFLGIF